MQGARISTRRLKATATKEGRVTSKVERFPEDNGIGMPEAVLNRAFEVFLTIKTKGKGTGLGLPMVRSFAECFGGVVSLQSRPDQGTSVTVLLPARDAIVQADKTVVTGPLSALPGGEESIVLAASDATFRSSVAQILSALGYRVICIETPLRTLSTATEHDARCLVVDAQTISEAFVRDIAGRLHSRKLGVVVVGHDDFDWADTRPVRVPKPFELSELGRAVRESMKGEA
jgi:hypothetical protein